MDRCMRKRFARLSGAWYSCERVYDADGMIRFTREQTEQDAFGICLKGHEVQV